MHVFVFATDFSESFRLGHLGQVYYHYAQIVLRLQNFRLTTGRTEWSQAQRGAVEHAALLVEYAANTMPPDVYRYAHNNAFTMISYGAAITLRVGARSCSLLLSRLVVDDSTKTPSATRQSAAG
jgi:hypothetical protein